MTSCAQTSDIDIKRSGSTGSKIAEKERSSNKNKSTGISNSEERNDTSHKLPAKKKERSKSREVRDSDCFSHDMDMKLLTTHSESCSKRRSALTVMEPIIVQPTYITEKPAQSFKKPLEKKKSSEAKKTSKGKKLRIPGSPEKIRELLQAGVYVPEGGSTASKLLPKTIQQLKQVLAKQEKESMASSSSNESSNEKEPPKQAGKSENADKKKSEKDCTKSVTQKKDVKKQEEKQKTVDGGKKTDTEVKEKSLESTEKDKKNSPLILRLKRESSSTSTDTEKEQHKNAPVAKPASNQAEWKVDVNSASNSKEKQIRSKSTSVYQSAAKPNSSEESSHRPTPQNNSQMKGKFLAPTKPYNKPPQLSESSSSEDTTSSSPPPPLPPQSKWEKVRAGGPFKKKQRETEREKDRVTLLIHKLM